MKTRSNTPEALNAPPSSPRPTAHRRSAIAMLMVAGGLAAAMPALAQVNPDVGPVTTEASNKKIVPCVKTKIGGLAPCVKTRTTPGAIAPCVKTKPGAVVPCVKTKTVVTAP